MNRRPAPQALIGVIIVVVGALALLRALGVVDLSIGELIGTWWPLVLIALGISALLTVPRAWIGPSGVIAIGVLFQLNTLDLVQTNVWDVLWPVLIIAVGLRLLTRVGERGTDDDVLNSAVLWWGSQRRTRSQSFRGGSLSAIMGGIDVDLREAGFQHHAEISVFTLWGGVEIKVPPTWRVRVSGLPLLGGWDDKTVRPLDPEAPELVVHVTAIMGGAEVKN